MTAAEHGAKVRVHVFAAMRGVTVDTVWNWIHAGKVRAEKDPGGHRWLVVIENTPGNTGKLLKTPDNSR